MEGSQAQLFHQVPFLGSLDGSFVKGVTRDCFDEVLEFVVVGIAHFRLVLFYYYICVEVFN